MKPRDIALAALGGLAVLTLLAQLCHRANLAADAAQAIRRDSVGVTVLLDRAANAGVLGAGWDHPILNQGVTTNAPAADLLLPTSTAAGDLELTLVLASGAPATRDRPVAIAIDQTPVATWTPRTESEETVRLHLPAAARERSYQVTVAFDLTGGRPGPASPPPIRVLKATTRITPPA
jgi:hypothetical protein